MVLGFLACAAIVRRHTFLDAGGFSPLLFFVGEERLLAYDLTAVGRLRCYAPEIIAVRPVGKTPLKANSTNNCVNWCLLSMLGQVGFQCKLSGNCVNTAA